jgi:CTP:phosphocholine cytidylyltransferase-like protein
MNEVVKFKAFCIERYKYLHDMKGQDVLRLFKEYGVMDYISSFYDVLHSFGDRYIISEIDEFIAARQ